MEANKSEILFMLQMLCLLFMNLLFALAKGLYLILVAEKKIQSVVIDTELDFIKLGLARQVAEAMGARYLKLEDLRAGSLADAVRLHLPDGESPALTSEAPASEVLTSEDARSMVQKLNLT